MSESDFQPPPMNHWREGACDDAAFVAHSIQLALNHLRQMISERGLRDSPDIGDSLQLVERNLEANILLVKAVSNRYLGGCEDLTT